jgi:hypothetical protein
MVGISQNGSRVEAQHQQRRSLPSNTYLYVRSEILDCRMLQYPATVGCLFQTQSDSYQTTILQSVQIEAWHYSECKDVEIFKLTSRKIDFLSHTQRV